LRSSWRSTLLCGQERRSKELAKPSTAATAAVPNGLYIIQPEEIQRTRTKREHRLNLIIWGWLLLITGIEVLLGYLQIAPPATMLLI
jgi:hypothetical protein